MSNPALFANSNYHLYSPTPAQKCNVLTRVSVTIKVTKDMVAIPIAPSAAGEQSNGVSFQFNCSPLTSQDASTWQQYVMTVSRTGQQLGWSINNFRPGDPGSDPSINLSGSMATIPSDLPAGYVRIPAGYTLKVELETELHSGNVTAATFSAFDEDGVALCQPVTAVLTENTDKHGNQITVGDLSPIADVTMDIVGYANGANTLLNSGSGTIIYQAHQILVTAAAPPGCVIGFGTAESSNVTYGELPQSPSTTFTQSFDHEPGSSYIAVQGPGASLALYSQPIGSKGWAKLSVAGGGSAHSSPAVTFSNYNLAPWIAVQGPQNSLSFYWFNPPAWIPENVAPAGWAFSAPAIAQLAQYIFIAARGKDDSLKVYWQQIGDSSWYHQAVAGPGTTFSAPSLAQINDQACIAVQGPENGLDFYWQPIGGSGWPGTIWNPVPVAGPNTTFSPPSLAQIGNAAAIAAEGLDSKLKFYSQLPGAPALWSPETVDDGPAAYSAPSLAQIGDSACIAVRVPGNALNFYWQPISGARQTGTRWNLESVARPNTTFSAPSLAQIGNSACVIAQGPADSINFYWQTIGTKSWQPQTVASSATEQSGSLSVGPPLAPPGG